VVKRSGRGGLADLALESAQGHLDAALLLGERGFYAYSSFHLLTGIEELSKSKLESLASMDFYRGLSWAGKRLESTADQARHQHAAKIPMGLLLVFFESEMVEKAELANRDPPATAEELERARVARSETMEWTVKLLMDHPGLREEAIYTGPGPDGIAPRNVDWQQFANRIGPVLERAIEFTQWTRENPLSAGEIEQGRDFYRSVVKKVGGR